MAYYEVTRIPSIEYVRDIFPDGQADDLNWLFLSTSGVHGTYMTLDDIEKSINNEDIDEEERVCPDITVLIIQPRIVRIHYGHIDIEKEDIPYLRRLVESTIEAIKRSQVGNLPKEGKPDV